MTNGGLGGLFGKIATTMGKIDRIFLSPQLFPLPNKIKKNISQSKYNISIGIFQNKVYLQINFDLCGVHFVTQISLTLFALIPPRFIFSLHLANTRELMEYLVMRRDGLEKDDQFLKCRQHKLLASSRKWNPKEDMQ